MPKEHCTLTLSAVAPSVIPMYFVDMTNQNSYRFPAFTFQLSQSIFPKKNQVERQVLSFLCHFLKFIIAQYIY